MRSLQRIARARCRLHLFLYGTQPLSSPLSNLVRDFNFFHGILPGAFADFDLVKQRDQLAAVHAQGSFVGFILARLAVLPAAKETVLNFGSEFSFFHQLFGFFQWKRFSGFDAGHCFELLFVEFEFTEQQVCDIHLLGALKFSQRFLIPL